MARKEGYRWRRGGWEPNDRQRDVLDLLAEGKTNAEIAVRLGITVDGAKWHVGELLSQTGCEHRQALASWWRQERGWGRSPGFVFWPSPLRLAIAASAVAVAGSLLLLAGVLSDLGEEAGSDLEESRTLFADVGEEESPPTSVPTPDASACPAEDSDLGLVDGAQLEAKGFVQVSDAFSRHDCQILVANRHSLSFVRVPRETTLRIGEGSSQPIPIGMGGSERYEIEVEGRSLTVAILAGTRFNYSVDERMRPGAELAISAEDSAGRSYQTAVDSNGGLWIHPEPLGQSTAVNYWSGEALEVSGAQPIGKLDPEGQFRFTSCDGPLSREPCDVNYRPLEAGLRAPVGGKVRCLTADEVARWNPEDEPVAGIELDTGDVVLRFERLHTGVPGLGRDEDCDVRNVRPGELIGRHYHYWVRALSADGTPLSIAVSFDGALYVGDFRETLDCPCLQGS